MKGAKIAESNSTTCEWIFHQLAVKNLNVSAEQRSTASVIQYSVFRRGLSGLKNIWPVIMTGIPLSIILSPGWLSSGCLPHKSNQLEPFFCLTQNFCTGELTPIPLSWTGGSKYQCSETNRVCKFYRRVESVWLLLHKFWSHFGISKVSWHVYTIVRDTRSTCGGPLTWKAQIHGSIHRANFDSNLPPSCFVMQYI